MGKQKISSTKLLRLIDKEKMTQSQAAKELGVSRQAVNMRLMELRGKTTLATAVGKIDKIVDDKLDAVAQLKKINEHAHTLLDAAEGDAQMAVKLMAEIRNQLRLQLDIFETLYSLQAAAEFQDAVLETLNEVEPELRNKVISKLNKKSALRSALRFR